MFPNPTNHVCPLCQHVGVQHFHHDKRRDYFRCPVCELVFVPAAQHVSRISERAEYDLHCNDLDDPGYRQFLSRLAEPLSARLASAAHGLDFGCGPGPLLANMLRQQGHDLAVYDPMYADNPDVLSRNYDFITCTEVIEHFRQPAQAFEQIFQCLKPGGILGLMTKLVIDASAFSRWHYKNDPTHVSYYSPPTMTWLATSNHCEIEFIGTDVMILTRQPAGDMQDSKAA
ncbi:MAG: class I SAM-dependent methyltransferase [Methylomonas sp.]|nr:class I SAM-dependent methyltransferase [Methylomonas sp.]PPD19477.1 MAG: methyltransferase [Methylomonas sp.]PPD25208.1 MAG: methyltransferase [Methylomonas sp.]PPD34870.1 MAG: methyltransferase [Methylomonas sp.]PPD38039.1 MAG: methyltransferase [Methylomonas sp.]